MLTSGHFLLISDITRMQRLGSPSAGSRRTSSGWRRLCLALALPLLAVVPATAATESQNPEVRIPRSVQDHLELAGLYEKVAVQFHEETASVRRSLAEDLRRISLLPNKTGAESPWFTKLRREAERKIADASKAAAEAERFADYHRMRAKELEGLELATLRRRLSTGTLPGAVAIVPRVEPGDAAITPQPRGSS